MRAKSVKRENDAPVLGAFGSGWSPLRNLGEALCEIMFGLDIRSNHRYFQIKLFTLLENTSIYAGDVRNRIRQLLIPVSR
jgi:hypothetical protein